MNLREITLGPYSIIQNFKHKITNLGFRLKKLEPAGTYRATVSELCCSSVGLWSGCRPTLLCNLPGCRGGCPYAIHGP